MNVISITLAGHDTNSLSLISKHMGMSWKSKCLISASCQWCCVPTRQTCTQQVSHTAARPMDISTRRTIFLGKIHRTISVISPRIFTTRSLTGWMRLRDLIRHRSTISRLLHLQRSTTRLIHAWPHHGKTTILTVNITNLRHSRRRRFYLRQTNRFRLKSHQTMLCWRTPLRGLLSKH